MLLPKLMLGLPPRFLATAFCLTLGSFAGLPSTQAQVVRDVTSDIARSGVSAEDGRAISVRRPSLGGPTSEQATREDLFAQLARDAAEFNRLERLVRQVSQLAKPSVIHIEAHKTETKGGQQESYDEAGSGIVIGSGNEIWVMTNRHVILGARPQEILLRSSDGRDFYPTRILDDPNTDVAVMKVNVRDLIPARIGNSHDTQVGNFVVAVGSPFGLSHSVTFGILSAKGRRDLSLGEQRIELQDFFQSDAAINPGNSGGPLLNLRGEVIALNTAIASSSGGSEGIGFAIPINMAMRVAEQLIAYGKLRRGYLGVTLDPDVSLHDLRTAGYNISGGALVKDVRSGSPAEAAHLQTGDVIVEFNGVSVDNDDHLVAQVGLAPLESEIPMIIYRDGKRYTTDVVLRKIN